MDKGYRAMIRKEHGKTNLLCRIIGHRWTAYHRYSIDGCKAKELVIFGCCTRCGEPIPQDLMPTDEC